MKRKYWIYIERENSKDLMVGPYPKRTAAEHAMDNASLIDMFCEEDCVDCYVTKDQPSLFKVNVVTADLDDPDHTGEKVDIPEEEQAVIKLLSYEIDDGS